MTTPEEGTQGHVESPEEVTQAPDTGSDNKPPYASYLEGLPTSVVPLVEPIFKKWDSDTGKKFQEVHSQYETYKPWSNFVDNGVDPEDALRGLILLQKLQENPQEVYQQIGKSFGFGEQGQQPEQTVEEFEDGLPTIAGDPRFQQVEQMTQLVADYIVKQEQQKRQAEADSSLDKELSDLKSKHGDFDEAFVISQMLNGKTGEQAVQLFNQVIDSALKQRQRPAAPTIMNSGGGVPSTTVDVGKASKKEIQNLIQQRLAQAAQET
jgi:hypothetical protein